MLPTTREEKGKLLTLISDQKLLLDHNELSSNPGEEAIGPQMKNIDFTFH